MGYMFKVQTSNFGNRKHPQIGNCFILLLLASCGDISPLDIVPRNFQMYLTCTTFLQWRKLRLTEAKLPVQGLTALKCWVLVLNLDPCDSAAYRLATSPVLPHTFQAPGELSRLIFIAWKIVDIVLKDQCFNNWCCKKAIQQYSFL